MINNINEYFKRKYNKQLKKQSSYWHLLCFCEYLKINDLENAKNYSKKILKEIIILNNWKNLWLTKKEFFKLVAITFLPIFIIKIIKK